MKRNVLAKAVALAMVFLFTGCVPSARIEGKIVPKRGLQGNT